MPYPACDKKHHNHDLGVYYVRASGFYCRICNPAAWNSEFVTRCPPKLHNNKRQSASLAAYRITADFNRIVVGPYISFNENPCSWKLYRPN